MNYKKLVKPDTFIGKYMQYMSNIETPEAYDFWSAVWALGVGVGRDVIVDRPHAPVHLNWYVILAAESGTTRKSTAVQHASRLVQETTNTIGISTRTSSEQFESVLARQTEQTGEATVYFAVPELVSVLGREGYLKGMPGLLTDLYDCPAERTSPGTKQGGETYQRNVYVSFLSASTPSWLITAINPAVIEGGFTSRVLFVAEDTRKKLVAWPQRRSPDEWKEVERLYRDITETARTFPSIQISAGALRKFTEWYRTRVVHNDPFRSSFEAREDDHVLRLAACLSINARLFQIQATHIRDAIQIIRHAKDRAFGLFGGGLSLTARIGDGIDNFRRYLIEAGMDGMKHADLFKKCRRKLDITEFKLLAQIMHECQMIQVFEIKGTRGKIYRATQKLQGHAITSEVLAKLNLME